MMGGPGCDTEVAVKRGGSTRTQSRLSVLPEHRAVAQKAHRSFAEMLVGCREDRFDLEGGGGVVEGSFWRSKVRVATLLGDMLQVGGGMDCFRMCDVHRERWYEGRH